MIAGRKLLLVADRYRPTSVIHPLGTPAASYYVKPSYNSGRDSPNLPKELSVNLSLRTGRRPTVALIMHPLSSPAGHAEA